MVTIFMYINGVCWHNECSFCGVVCQAFSVDLIVSLHARNLQVDHSNSESTIMLSIVALRPTSGLLFEIVHRRVPRRAKLAPVNLTPSRTIRRGGERGRAWKFSITTNRQGISTGNPPLPARWVAQQNKNGSSSGAPHYTRSFLKSRLC
jgi:hypothetical protein